jgi:rubrerythrin
VNAPNTLQQLMSDALALERRAVERYTEFADVLEAHNNNEVAALFRTLAQHEAKHVEQILQKMGWRNAPPAATVDDAPEAPPLESAHYLMQPYHALEIALDAEQRAHDFFDAMVKQCEAADVRAAAIEMREEERQHVALLQTWLATMPKPPENWWDDPDPPRYDQ